MPNTLPVLPIPRQFRLTSATIPLVMTLFVMIPLVTTLTGCEQRTQPVDTAQNVQPIELLSRELSPVRQGALAQQYAITGSIQAVQQTSIQSQQSAIAENVMVNVGQTVQKGQVLLQLNSQDSSAKLAQAQANLLSAQAQAKQAQRVMQRKQRLLAQGFIARVEFEQSQLDYQTQRENVNVQQANVALANKTQQDGKIRSPMNGVISQRNIETGQLATVGQTLFEIVDPTQLELKGAAPIEALDALKVGQDVQFQLLNNSTSYTARITRVAPVANQANRQIEFYAKPQQPLASQSIGAYVQGQLTQQGALTGQLIALDRIQNIERKPFVWLVRGQKLLKVFIRVEQQDPAQNLALVRGLAFGDRIAQVNFDDQDQHKTVTIKP